MKPISTSLILLVAFCCVAKSFASEPDSTPIDFVRDVAPILAKNCVACHNEKKPEGGLNLESHSALMQGGDSGPAVEAGNVESGELLARVADNDDPMPPDGNAVGAKRLTEEEIAILQKWVEAGALTSHGAPSSQFGWQPLPESVQPIYALATSPDGNYVAFGRGNQAFVMRQGEMSAPDQAFSLVDPKVGDVLRQTNPSSADAGLSQATHLDIVQSIAFSPDSQLVATGGYRSVKIWQRRTEPLQKLAEAISFSGDGWDVAISPDGNRLAASHENQLEIADLDGARTLRLLKVHSDKITGLAWLDGGHELWSTDSGGTTMLTSSESGQTRRLTGEAIPPCVRIHRLGQNRFVGITNAHTLIELKVDPDQGSLDSRSIDGIHDVAAIGVASESEGLIAIGHSTGTCRVVNSTSWSVVQEFETPDPIALIAISPKGDCVATAGVHSSAQLWKVEDGTLVASLDRDYEFGQRIATAQQDTARQEGMLTRLNATLAELTKVAEGEEAARAKLQESRDQTAADLEAKKTGIETATAEVVDAEKALTDSEAAVAEAMKLVETRKAELEAKRKAVEEANKQRDSAAEELAKRDQALATAQDATQRAASRVPEMQQTISAEQQRLEEFLRHRDTLTNDPLASPKAREIAFSPDGSRVVVADDAARVQLYHTSDGSPEAVWKSGATLVALTAMADGRLLGLDQQGTATIWDTHLPWELKRTIGTYEESPWSDRITALDFSPDGTRLAVGSGPPSRFGEIAVVDVSTGDVVNHLGQVHSDTVLALEFSPGGRMLASGGADKICRIFDAESGQAIRALEGHTHHVLALSWKDDGVTLASGSADNSVKIWNVESGTQTRTVGGFKKEVTSLAFVGPTDQFVVVDAAGVAQLIEASVGKQIRAFAGADGAILAVDIGANNTLLYAGGQSGNTWVWKIEDGTKLP